MKNSNDKLKYWSEQIKAWKQSGLSQDKFCRDNSLSVSTFHYWRKRIIKKKSSFVPIKVKKEKPVTSLKSLPNPKWVAEVLLEMSQFFDGTSR